VRQAVGARLIHSHRWPQLRLLKGLVLRRTRWLDDCTHLPRWRWRAQSGHERTMASASAGWERCGIRVNC